MSNYQSWTVGKIDASDTQELDKRVEYLIYIRERITKSIQSELDYIYDVVARRDMAGKA